MLVKAALVFDKKIWQGAMDVSADLLTGLGRAKDADYRNSRTIPLLRGAMVAKQRRVKRAWRGLVMVYAIQTDSEPCLIQLEARLLGCSINICILTRRCCEETRCLLISKTRWKAG